MTTAPLVSVIIPTKNSAKTISECIASVKKQTYPNIECIVVDNYSSDTTQQLALQHNAHLIVSGPERSSQRNAGAAHASGNFFVFIDSDMELSPTVIEECVIMSSKNAHIQAIILPEESFGTTIWARCKQFERSLYANIPWLHAARFFRKSAFKEISGFDEKVIGAEDFDIQSKTIEKFGISAIGYCQAIIKHNEGALTLRKLLGKKYYYGSTMEAYKNKKQNRRILYKQANPITRIAIFFRHPAVIVQHPIIFIATCAMKTLEFCALALGYLTKRAV